MSKEIELRRIAIESHLLNQLEKAVANFGVLQDPVHRIQKKAIKKLEEDLDDDNLSGYRAVSAARAITDNMARINKQILDMYDRAQGISGLIEDEEITDVEEIPGYANMEQERASERLMLALINSSLGEENDSEIEGLLVEMQEQPPNDEEERPDKPGEHLPGDTP